MRDADQVLAACRRLLTSSRFSSAAALANNVHVVDYGYVGQPVANKWESGVSCRMLPLVTSEIGNN